MQYFRKIKSFFSNPKNKSLTLLAIYAVFFIFVFIVLNGSNNSTSITKPAKKSYQEIDNYNYVVTFTTTNNKYVLDGTYYKGNTIFSYDNFRYYYDGNLYLIENNYYSDTSLWFDVSKFFNNNLYTLADDVIEESKTVFKDGIEKIVYSLNSNKFNSYFYGTNTSFDSNILIEVSIKEDAVFNILFDLTPLSSELNEINISYTDIDNISGLQFNKEDYIYRE